MSVPDGLSDLERFLDQTGRASKDAEPTGLTAEMRRERSEILGRLETLHNADHYAVLGVEERADEGTVRNAYYALARRFHPDKVHKPHLEDLLPKLEAMFASITEAYNTLSDPAARSEYDRSRFQAMRGGGAAADKQEAKKRARNLYLKGRKEMENRQIFEAMRLFESAVQEDGSRAEYFQYLGICQGQNPKWRKKAEENLLKALELSPGSAEVYIALARLYKRGGLERRAQEMYRQALAWDPENREAAAAAQTDGDAQGSGLLRSIFKKD